MAISDEIQSFELKYQTDAKELAEVLALNIGNLQRHMVEQPSLYGKFGLRYAKAKQQREFLEILVESYHSLLYKGVRGTFTAKEKPTERQIESVINGYKEWRMAQTKLNDAKTIEELAKQALTALVHRKDMLVQLNANQREEIKTKNF